MIEKKVFLCFEHQPFSKKHFGNCSGVGSPRRQCQIEGELSGKTEILGAGTGKRNGRAMTGLINNASEILKPLNFFTTEESFQIE